MIERYPGTRHHFNEAGEFLQRAYELDLGSEDVAEQLKTAEWHAIGALQCMGDNAMKEGFYEALWTQAACDSATRSVINSGHDQEPYDSLMPALVYPDTTTAVR